MQQATSGGLRRAVGVERRETFVPIYNGTQLAVQLLEEQWATPTPMQAIEILRKPDVTVTNLSDKELQLQKLGQLDALVRRLNMGGTSRALLSSSADAASSSEAPSLLLVFGISRAVGPKPEGRTWRDEWWAALEERYRIRGEEYEYHESQETHYVLRVHQPAVEFLVQSGWPRDRAEAYVCISAGIPHAVAATVADRSNRYAATVHLVCDALAERAAKLKMPAPSVYWPLTGKMSLSETDPAWKALSGLQVGDSFTTNGVAKAEPSDGKLFSKRGLVRNLFVCDQEGEELMDSDVVCFRSARSDARAHHSLIRMHSAYHLPPLSTVTLESVQQPGKWKVDGLWVRRRLYNVAVSYST